MKLVEEDNFTKTLQQEGRNHVAELTIMSILLGTYSETTLPAPGTMSTTINSGHLTLFLPSLLFPRHLINTSALEFNNPLLKIHK